MFNKPILKITFGLLASVIIVTAILNHFVFLTPFEKSAHIEQLCDRVKQAIDKLFTAQIPPEYHKKDILVRQMKTAQKFNGNKHLPESAKNYPAMKTMPSLLMVLMTY